MPLEKQVSDGEVTPAGEMVFVNDLHAVEHEIIGADGQDRAEIADGKNGIGFHQSSPLFCGCGRGFLFKHERSKFAVRRMAGFDRHDMRMDAFAD